MDATTVRSILLHSKDFYFVLGVERSAPAEEVKRAYRKRALLLHPDKVSGKAEAEAFQAVARAYEVLSDSDARLRYDLMGDDLNELPLGKAIFFSVQYLIVKMFAAKSSRRAGCGTTSTAWVHTRLIRWAFLSVLLLAMLFATLNRVEERRAAKMKSFTVSFDCVAEAMLHSRSGHSFSEGLRENVGDVLLRCQGRAHQQEAHHPDTVPFFATVVAPAANSHKRNMLSAARRIHRQCKQEFDLRWASEQRYEGTAVQKPLTVPDYQSPNPTPADKRKYPVITWRKKRYEPLQFTVKDEADLYSLSPQCAALKAAVERQRPTG